MKIDSLKRAIKITILVGMICFFFPFVLVSCSGGGEADMTGVEMMINTSFDDDVDFDEDDPPNYYLWIAFGLGVAGLILAFSAKQENNHNLIPTGATMAGGAVFLLLFRSTFEQFYGLDEYGGGVSIEYKWGWVLALIAYVTASVASFLSRSITGENEIVTSDSDNRKTKDSEQKTPSKDRKANSDWKCPKCGKSNKYSNNFCIYCATPRPEKLGSDLREKEESVLTTKPVERVNLCPCGAKLKPGARFCVACGRAIELADEESISSADSKAPESAAKSAVRIRMASSFNTTGLDVSTIAGSSASLSSAFKKPDPLQKEFTSSSVEKDNKGEITSIGTPISQPEEDRYIGKHEAKESEEHEASIILQETDGAEESDADNTL